MRIMIFAALAVAFTSGLCLGLVWGYAVRAGV